jgi:predicted RNA-binding protein with PUA-like domain
MIGMPYLLKSEPDQYSFEDLERDGETLWDGVTNPVAVRHLGEMKSGDKLVYYHTGKERQAVGTASVVTVDTSDPKAPKVRVKAGKRLGEPKTLAEIKAEKRFADSPLVKQGRLSVVPLTAEQYHWLAGRS